MNSCFVILTESPFTILSQQLKKTARRLILFVKKNDVKCVHWDLSGRTIFSGGSDRFFKHWNYDLTCLKAMSNADSIEMIKPLENEMVAIGGGLNKNISVWKLPRLNFPTHSFKTEFKEPILKFDVDLHNTYLVAASWEDTQVKLFSFEDFVENHRCLNMSATADQNDNVFFSFFDKRGILGKFDASIKEECLQDLMFVRESSFAHKKSEQAVPLVSNPPVISKKLKEIENQFTPKIKFKGNDNSIDFNMSPRPFETESYGTFKTKLVYFEDKYKRTDVNIETAIDFNLELASVLKSQEIADSWGLLKSYYEELIVDRTNIEFPVKERSLAEGTGKTNAGDGTKCLRDFLDYYALESDNNFAVIDPLEIFYNEGKVFIHNNLDAKLRSKKKKNHGLFHSDKKVLFSKLTEDIIVKLINKGELIHAFTIYQLLKPFLVTVLKPQFENWEFWYFMVLKDHQLFKHAAKLALNSEFENLNKQMTQARSFDIACPSCKTLIEVADGKQCSKCFKQISCGICKKEVNRLMLVCSFCGHGGHLKEIIKHFHKDNDNLCPEGCDHRCFTFN